MSEALNTPFTHKHIALGAKMAPFAGYNMPISYTGINVEHAAELVEGGAIGESMDEQEEERLQEAAKVIGGGV